MLNRKVTAFAMLVLAVFLQAGPARAACTSPTAQSGGLDYDDATKTYTICDGAAWKNLGEVDYSGAGARRTFQVGNDAGACAAAKLGRIRYNGTSTWEYCNGTNWINLLSGAAGTPAAPDRSIQFNNASAFGGAATFVYDAAGNVGIGTATPQRPLHVLGVANNPAARFEYSSGSGTIEMLGNAASGSNIYFGVSGGTTTVGGITYDNGNNRLSFRTANVGNRMVIDSGGNVGVGTTSPGQKLHVVGNTYVNGLTYTDALVIGGNVNANPTFRTPDNIKLVLYNPTAPNESFALSPVTNDSSGASATVLLNTNGSSYFTGGNVGLGTTSPTYLLALGGNSARAIGMERHTTANTAGNSLTVQAGGATAGATSKNGGDLILSGGIATGTGDSSIYLKGYQNASPVTLMSLTGDNNGVSWGEATAATGTAATAWGTGSTASGYYSTAWGPGGNDLGGAQATQYGSTAWGNGTVSSNYLSTAWGESTTASGPSSTAWGQSTTASATLATAFGFSTSAGGGGSTAWGQNSNASGYGSTVWGEYSSAAGEGGSAWGSVTTASGDFSTAWGNYTVASGASSTALGTSTTAAGDYSTAWGAGSQALSNSSTAWGGATAGVGSGVGDFATAWGWGSQATGYASTAWGARDINYVVASGDVSTAFGSDTTASGWGSTAWGYLSAASGYFGTAWGTGSTASGQYSTAWGDHATASGGGSTAWGANTVASNDYSNATGIGSSASGAASFAFGEWSQALDEGSTAWGINTVAGVGDGTGTGSTAWGYGSDATNYYSTAWGSNTTASGESSTAWGSGTTASGHVSTALGFDATAGGFVSMTWGRNSNASGDYSTAWGDRTIASGVGSTAWGGYDSAGTVAGGNFSTAFGLDTNAGGEGSTAWGYGSNASGLISTAAGYNSSASGIYTTALGYNSNASGDYSTAFGASVTASGNYSLGIGLTDDGANTVSGNESLGIFLGGSGADVTSNHVLAVMGGDVGIGTTTPQSALQVPDGKYLQAEDNNAGPPPTGDCDADAERGRLSIDTTNNRLYVCNGATRGWDYLALTN